MSLRPGAGSVARSTGRREHGRAPVRYPSPAAREGVSRAVRREGTHVLRAIADVLRQVGSAVATVVTLPFRAVARLFGGASGTARGHRA
ncbi:hypothetical protein GCM10018783_10640 [Streptomyces griseosporeus]|nr:hypothetical protein GCM10018783_10640 [Streptomyces griseosporeus]